MRITNCRSKLLSVLSLIRNHTMTFFGIAGTLYKSWKRLIGDHDESSKSSFAHSGLSPALNFQPESRLIQPLANPVCLTAFELSLKTLFFCAVTATGKSIKTNTRYFMRYCR